MKLLIELIEMEKKNKLIQIGKVVKLALFADDMVIYITFGLSTNQHLSCLKILAILNNATLNIHK